MFWVYSAVTEHNSNCIQALEKRVIQLEDRCITDIDEVEPNYFVAKRRCGPDKEEKPKPVKVEKPNTIKVIVTKNGKTTETEYLMEDADFNEIMKKALE
jgi:hypothetical protein